MYYKSVIHQQVYWLEKTECTYERNVLGERDGEQTWKAGKSGSWVVIGCRWADETSCKWYAMANATIPLHRFRRPVRSLSKTWNLPIPSSLLRTTFNPINELFILFDARRHPEYLFKTRFHRSSSWKVKHSEVLEESQLASSRMIQRSLSLTFRFYALESHGWISEY